MTRTHLPPLQKIGKYRKKRASLKVNTGKPESTDGYNYILAKGFSQSPNGEICLRINDGKYEVGSWNGTSYYAAFDVPEEDLGTWVYLCGTYDGEYWRLYRNGEEVAALQSTVGAISVNSDWSIGSTGNGTQRFFNGQIKQVQLYDTAVTPAQIADMYAAAPKPEVQSAKTGKFAPIEFGGEAIAQAGSEYTLYFNANGYDSVSLLIDWGEGEESVVVEGESGIFTRSHIYSTAGVRQIRVTNVVAKYGDTERSIDVYGDLDHEVTVEDPVIYNGDFNIMPDELRQNVETYGWWIDTLPGWNGMVEVRDGFVELDGDQMQPEGKDQYYTGELCTITSDPISMIEGDLYRLSFTTGNRSDFAEDNIVKVTVPGEILYINNIPKDEFLYMISSADNLHIDEPHKNPYNLVFVGDDVISFSAGGGKYGTPEDPTLGEEGYKISSVVFAAASSSGSVSFQDYSIDIISSYGPFLYDVSMAPVTPIVNLTADSTNLEEHRSEYYKILNERIEDNTSLPGYTIAMGTTGELLLDCSNIKYYDHSYYQIKLSVDDITVLEVDEFNMLLTDFVDCYGTNEATIAIPITARPGTKNGSTWVNVEVYGIKDGETTTIASDRVKVTTSLFIMGDHTDYGQLLKPELNTNYMWDCDLANNTYKTPKSGGKKYLNGRCDADYGKGDSYLVSALTYTESIAMEYQYDFDRSYGNVYGYVQADVLEKKEGQEEAEIVKKLSFVGNGGVKYGAESGGFEAAIFDVRGMVAMILDDPNILTKKTLSNTQITQLKTKIDEDSANKNNLLISNASYKKEPITKLVDAVEYGGAITSAYGNSNYSSSLNSLVNFLAEVFAKTPVGQKITLQINNPMDAYNNSISIGKIENEETNTPNTVYYQSSNVPFTSSNEEYTGRIHLQAHWGSGVVYSNISIEGN